MTAGHQPTDAQQLQALLRDHGLKSTAQRVAVLSLFHHDSLGDSGGEELVGHLTAAAIHERLHERGDDLDLTTVYRTAATLADVGLLHAITSDHVTAYGAATRAHHHAVCTRCGLITEIPAETLNGVLAQARQVSHFGLDDSSVTLRGLCPNCRTGEESPTG